MNTVGRAAGETIFALASGAPPCGIAVVRISGSGIRSGLDTIIGTLPEPRHLVRRTIRGNDGRLLDRGMVVFFPEPGSFDGGDMAELHLHGGPAVVAAVLAELGELAGFRPAEAGEFTRRAFFNGKVDLVEVEALADLVAAETEAQRRQAVDLAGGSASGILDGWRTRLIRARGYLEAELDFADEEDIPDRLSDELWRDVEALRQDIVNHVSDRRGERLRSGVEVVVLGAPNAGKSSLINALARRDVAIVAPAAGTTRDLIEARLDLDGMAVTIVDTAGLREDTGDPVEMEGIRRARVRAAGADLALVLTDVGEGGPEVPAPDGPALRVGTKSDLLDSEAERRLKSAAGERLDCLVSAKTGAGMDDLIGLIVKRCGELVGGREAVVVTRERHRHALRGCVTALGEAIENSSAGPEVRAEALRRATDALGRVTGAVDVEDLLDVVFSEFCIGK